MADDDKVRELLEFYFSDANLAHDHFLRGKIAAGKGGYVGTDVLLGFRKLCALTTDSKVVLESAKASKLLEANSSGVRRKRALQPSSACDSRTVFVTPLPQGSQHSRMQTLFSSHGPVECVRLLPDLTPLGCFVVFATDAGAQAALRNPPPSLSVLPRAEFEAHRKAVKRCQKRRGARANTALLCTRCCLPFNESTRPPVALRCVHTLCLVCAKALAVGEGGEEGGGEGGDEAGDVQVEVAEGEGEGEGEAGRVVVPAPVKCPTCAVVTRPTALGFGMRREVMDALGAAVPREQANALCSVCDGTHAAAFKCEDCDELMCEAVCAVHVRSKLTAAHTVTRVSAARPAFATLLDADLCSVHAQPVIFFCKDHASSLCALCVEGAHVGHALQSLEGTGAEDCHEALRVAKDQARTLQGTVATLRAERDRVCAEVTRSQQDVNKYFDDIEAHRRRLLAKLDLTKKRACQLHADAVYHLHVLALRTRHLEALLKGSSRSKAQLMQEMGHLREQLEQLKVVQSTHCAKAVRFFPPVPATVFNNADVEPNQAGFLQLAPRNLLFDAERAGRVAVSLEGAVSALRVVQVQVGASVSPKNPVVVQRDKEVIARGNPKPAAPTTITLREPVALQPGTAVALEVQLCAARMPRQTQVVRFNSLHPAVSDNPRLFVASCAWAQLCFVCELADCHEKPKAEEPKAEKPKAEEPKAEKPKAEKKAEKPKAEKPKAEEPKAEKKAEKPKAEKKAEKPKAEKPKAEEPKAEKPKAEKPKAKKPKAEKPKAEEPKAEEPKAEKKADKKNGGKK